jgi:small conductance mechanosensitive channel
MFMSETTLNLLKELGQAFAIVLAGSILISLVSRILRRTLKKSRLDAALHVFLINSVRILMWVIVAITALNSAGIPVTAFVTALGAAGVAVALALKDSLGNFAGGILIILTKPFSKGDYIEDYQTAGQVDKIDLLYTTLITFDNKIITIPNGKLANSTIVNFTRNKSRRVECRFSAGYQEDIGKVKELLLAVAESNSSIYTDPAPIVGVAGQGEGRVHFDLKVWCDTKDYAEIRYYLEEQVNLAFNEADINVTYPQMEVRLKK